MQFKRACQQRPWYVKKPETFRYVAWNVHEPVQGQFNFEGDADLAAFLKAAQDADLLVILRAGI